MRIQIPVSQSCKLSSEQPFNVVLSNGQYWYYQVKDVRLPAQARGYFVDVEAKDTVETHFEAVRLHEYNDGIPVEVPLTRPETLQEQMARMIQQHMVRMGEVSQDTESFEESNDFEVDEDPDPVSEYELTEMQEEYPLEVEAKEEKPNEHVEGSPKAGEGESVGADTRDGRGAESDPRGEHASDAVSGGAQ